MNRLSRSVLVALAASLVALATMSFECGPPGRDIPCTDQIAEGDVLHVEIVGRYTNEDGGVWAGGHFNGFGTTLPSCVGIDSLAIGVSFDAAIRGSRESMLCTQFGFVPLWDAPRWGGVTISPNLVRWAGAGASEVALSDGAARALGGCAGLYGISLIVAAGDAFANPGTDPPFGTFLKRYFRTNEPAACGPGFLSDEDPTGASVCGDMYLVQVTR